MLNVLKGLGLTLDWYSLAWLNSFMNVDGTILLHLLPLLFSHTDVQVFSNTQASWCVGSYIMKRGSAEFHVLFAVVCDFEDQVTWIFKYSLLHRKALIHPNLVIGFHPSLKY